jgi:hypothetical protein
MVLQLQSYKALYETINDYRRQVWPVSRYSTVMEFAMTGCGKPKKPFRKTSGQAKIPTGYLPNISLKSHCYSNLVNVCYMSNLHLSS